MAENEGARGAVLSRLRARLDRLGDLVGGMGLIDLLEPKDTVPRTNGTNAPSGLEAVFRAQERGAARTMSMHPRRRVSA